MPEKPGTKKIEARRKEKSLPQLGGEYGPTAAGIDHLKGVDPLIRKPVILELFGFSSSGLDLKVSRDEFPRPYKIGRRAIGWKLSELQAWQNSLEVT